MTRHFVYSVGLQPNYNHTSWSDEHKCHRNPQKQELPRSVQQYKWCVMWLSQAEQSLESGRCNWIRHLFRRNGELQSLGSGRCNWIRHLFRGNGELQSLGSGRCNWIRHLFQGNGEFQSPRSGRCNWMRQFRGNVEL